jgi:hypothetical protein
MTWAATHIRALGKALPTDRDPCSLSQLVFLRAVWVAAAGNHAHVACCCLAYP